MFQRSYLQTLTEKINEPRKFIQVLFGPRQVGKTTLIKQFIAQTTIPFVLESADAIPASNYTWLNTIWENIRFKIKSENLPDFILIIDEIQKINHLP